MTSAERDTGGYDSRAFVAEFYDFVPAYANRADREFYVECARQQGGRVLELGCGTGRLLIPIAQSGVHITGVDASRSMLARCREKLAQQPPAVQRRATVYRADMTTFAMRQRFSLAIAPFRAFQHLLRVEQQVACLRCVSRQLRRRGLLILDMFQVHAPRTYDPLFLKEELECEGVALPDGRVFSRSTRIAAFHRAEQYNDVELIYDVTHADGRRERLVHEFPFRYFFRYEVENLLARCGFELVDVFGNYDKTPLSDDSPEMIFVARKK